ncbi:MAG: PspC domain-containing protein [Deltaproteobacteria bacterium]|nr:PspC domain-containing protein [Deltaproteobacteria bacterium]
MSRYTGKMPCRSRNGLLLGVLKGLARHIGVAPWILRGAVIALAAFTSFWIVLCGYLAAALIMPLKPDNHSSIY